MNFAFFYLLYFTAYEREAVCNHDELSKLWIASGYDTNLTVTLMAERVGLSASTPVVSPFTGEAILSEVP